MCTCVYTYTYTHIHAHLRKQERASEAILRTRYYVSSTCVASDVRSCLLGVRVRTTKQSRTTLRSNSLNVYRQMIVYTVSVAKNNNASLQSN